jgi:hypothetical protein
MCKTRRCENLEEKAKLLVEVLRSWRVAAVCLLKEEFTAYAGHFEKDITNYCGETSVLVENWNLNLHRLRGPVLSHASP